MATPATPVAPPKTGSADSPSWAGPIIADGDAYVSVWASLDRTPGSRRAEIFATRFSSTGDRIAETRLGLADEVRSIRAAVTSEGDLLAAWLDASGGHVVRADRSLQQLTPQLTIAPAQDLNVACNSVGCLAVSWYGGQFEMLRLNRDGSVGASSAILSPNFNDGFSLAASGETYLLAPSPFRTQDPTTAIHVLNSDGAVLSTTVHDGGPCGVTRDATGYAVACWSGETIRLARLRADGSEQKFVELHAALPALARIRGLLIAASDAGIIVGVRIEHSAGIPGSSSESTRFARFSRELLPVDGEPQVIGTATCSNYLGGLAAGSNSFALTLDHHSCFSSPAAQLQIIPPLGGAQKAPVAFRTGPLSQTALAAASTGTTHLAVWREREIHGRHTIRAALFRDREPAHIEMLVGDAPENRSDAALAASDGRNFLVAWSESAWPPASTFRTAFVDSVSGTVRRGEILVGSIGGAIATDTTHYFVPILRDQSLLVARFAANGDYVDEFPVASFARFATLVYSEGTLLVVYAENDRTMARPYFTDGTAKGPAARVGGLTVEPSATAVAEGFSVLSGFGTASATVSTLSLEGSVLDSAPIPLLDLQGTKSAATVDGRAVFLVHDRSRFIVVVTHPAFGPGLLHMPQGLDARRLGQAGRHIVVLSERMSDGVSRVEHSKLAIAGSSRRRSVGR